MKKTLIAMTIAACLLAPMPALCGDEAAGTSKGLWLSTQKPALREENRKERPILKMETESPRQYIYSKGAYSETVFSSNTSVRGSLETKKKEEDERYQKNLGRMHRINGADPSALIENK